jgi:hypothetical protein
MYMDEQSRTTTDPGVVIIHPGSDEYAEERYSPPPIGLEPQPFEIAEYEAIPVEKLELWEGRLYGIAFSQEGMLVALLSNVGLRHVCHVSVGWPRWRSQSRGILAGARDDHEHANVRAALQWLYENGELSRAVARLPEHVAKQQHRTLACRQLVCGCDKCQLHGFDRVSAPGALHARAGNGAAAVQCRAGSTSKRGASRPVLAT